MLWLACNHASQCFANTWCHSGRDFLDHAAGFHISTSVAVLLGITMKQRSDEEYLQNKNKMKLVGGGLGNVFMCGDIR